MKDIIKDLYKELLNVKWYELPAMIVVLVITSPFILFLLLVVWSIENDPHHKELKEELDRMIEEIASSKK